MDKKIQITVRPCSESDPDLISFLKGNKEGFVRREGFLYFCAREPESGELAFATTLQKHEENVAAYRKFWEDYDKARGIGE